MIVKNNKSRKVWTFFIVVLTAGFIGGFSLAANFGCASEDKQDRARSAQVETSLPEGEQTGDLADRLSRAFERASSGVSSSVVSIIAEQEVQIRQFGFPDDAFRDFFGEDFFERFFGAPQPRQEEKRTVRSLGSGVIVTEDGYILTNNHFIENAEKLLVLMGDDKRYEAEVVGTDPPTDMAVIKIDGKDFPAAKLGDSDNINVGQWVIAIGNPFQLTHTVTAGIVSAKGRSSVGLAEYEDFIQTDASIYSGNSGGALADLDGRVVGINTAIASPTGGNIGIGFAIPINMAKKVMDALISEGEVVRGYIGLWLQDITDDLVEALNLDNKKGALVADVVEGGPADKAGIKRGDVIVEFDGQKIEDGTKLKNMVAQTQPGTEVEALVDRGGKETEVMIELTEKEPEETGRPAQKKRPGEEGASQKLGLEVQTLTSDIAQQLGYEGERGVVITQVFAGSPASEAGLRRGDLIQEVNRQTVRNQEEFERAIRALRSGDVLALLVRRGQNTFYVTLQIEGN